MRPKIFIIVGKSSHYCVRFLWKWTVFDVFNTVTRRRLITITSSDYGNGPTSPWYGFWCTEATIGWLFTMFVLFSNRNFPFMMRLMGNCFHAFFTLQPRDRNWGLTKDAKMIINEWCNVDACFRDWGSPSCLIMGPTTLKERDTFGHVSKMALLCSRNNPKRFHNASEK